MKIPLYFDYYFTCQYFYVASEEEESPQTVDYKILAHKSGWLSLWGGTPGA